MIITGNSKMKKQHIPAKNKVSVEKKQLQKDHSTFSFFSKLFKTIKTDSKMLREVLEIVFWK
jgi:hypothetical protein